MKTWIILDGARVNKDSRLLRHVLKEIFRLSRTDPLGEWFISIPILWCNVFLFVINILKLGKIVEEKEKTEFNGELIEDWVNAFFCTNYLETG